MKLTNRYEQTSCRLQVEGLPDLSAGQGDQTIGILTGFSLDLAGHTELEGKREHLQAMDALRESVGLRGYGQKDPLIEYKNEGYDMFLEMMTQMRRNVIYSMFMFQPAPAAGAAATA